MCYYKRNLPHTEPLSPSFPPLSRASETFEAVISSVPQRVSAYSWLGAPVTLHALFFKMGPRHNPAAPARQPAPAGPRILIAIAGTR